MKKLALTVILSATTVAASAASMTMAAPTAPFNGFFVNANIGALGYKADLSDVNSLTHQNASFDKDDIGFAAELEAGYDYMFSNKFMLGAVANYLYNTAEIKSTDDTPTVTFSEKHSVHNLFGVSAQLGYMLKQNAVLFVNVGPQWGTFKGSSRTNGVSGGKNFTKAGIHVAIGSKQSICNSHWFVQEKIGYTYFGSKTLVHSNGYSFKNKPQTLAGLIGVGYTFG